MIFPKSKSNLFFPLKQILSIISRVIPSMLQEDLIYPDNKCLIEFLSIDIYIRNKMGSMSMIVNIKRLKCGT